MSSKKRYEILCAQVDAAFEDIIRIDNGRIGKGVNVEKQRNKALERYNEAEKELWDHIDRMDVIKYG